MKKATIAVLIILFILITLILELVRENNYLKKAYPVQGFNFVNTQDYVEVYGNGYTTDTGGEIYSAPYLTNIKCFKEERICIQVISQEILGDYVVDSFIFNIKNWDKQRIVAERNTGSVLFILNLIFDTNEATIDAKSLKAKTGNIFVDIGTNTNTTKIVDKNFVLDKNLKRHLTIIDTPINWVFKGFRRR